MIATTRLFRYRRVFLIAGVFVAATSVLIGSTRWRRSEDQLYRVYFTQCNQITDITVDKITKVNQANACHVFTVFG
jgi:hypothetical protein